MDCTSQDQPAHFCAPDFGSYLANKSHDYELEPPDEWSVSDGWDNSDFKSNPDVDSDRLMRGELKGLVEDATDLGPLPTARLRIRNPGGPTGYLLLKPHRCWNHAGERHEECHGTVRPEIPRSSSRIPQMGPANYGAQQS
jgi:hypothetical protein